MNPPYLASHRPTASLSAMPRAEKLTGFVAWVQAHLTGDEKREAQLYLERLFQAFGHAGLQEAGATLEFHVAKAARVGGGTALADLSPPCVP